MHPNLTPQLYFDNTVKKLEKENKTLINKLLTTKGQSNAWKTNIIMDEIKAKTREINELKLTYQIK